MTPTSLELSVELSRAKPDKYDGMDNLKSYVHNLHKF